MSDETDRPQDAGRAHRRRGRPSAATSTLLARYQSSMRRELDGLLDELDGRPAPAGLLDVKPATVRPPIAERVKLWDLAIRLGRELGTEIDTTPPVDPAPARSRRRARVDFG